MYFILKCNVILCITYSILRYLASVMGEIIADLIPEWSDMDVDTLVQPVRTIEEKWQLVPAFLKVQGLVKQHIDSFNYFVNTDIKKIVEANSKITTEVDALFYVKYKDVRVGKPNIEEGLDMIKEATPHQCRLRDITYSAPITVDVEYMRGDSLQFARDICIGRMPIMLKSSNCILSTCRTHKEMAKYLECPLDPGGYFIVKGQEKINLLFYVFLKDFRKS
ncbi:hypothetical protein Avbf_06624 [Armadillidium vulgare]|nr:hypothetical protein Avbf_06624 [Armadillidium vulgare]